MIQLDLSVDEVCNVINALDFYSRIWIGQYNEIDNLLRNYDYDGVKSLKFDDYREDYLTIGECRYLL